MNLRTLRKVLTKAGADDEHVKAAEKDWRPRWFIQRVTERQFRDKQERLLPRPKQSYPPSLSNRERMAAKRERRLKDQAEANQ